MKITNVYAEELKDSRGKPTLEVFVEAGDNKGSFAVPSGASTGMHEAWELRGDDGGVDGAINNVNTVIKEALLGVDSSEQKKIDEILLNLDGTENKSNLGGNAMIGVSVAASKVAAKVKDITLVEHLRSLSNLESEDNVPFLYANLINGGSHAKTSLSFQEYMVVPKVQIPKEGLEIVRDVENELSKIIKEEFPETKVGDEGGYALDTKDVLLPLGILKRATENSGHSEKVSFAIDVAASSFFGDGEYSVGQEKIGKEDLINIYVEMIERFPIISIEDPLYEEDFAGFSEVLSKSGNTLIVGDDLTVTNKERLGSSIKNKSINALIIKPNQIGTLSETIETIELAKENGIRCIVSHRSGETKDAFIADLAVAFECFGVKAGSPVAPERAAKYDRLVEITN